MHKIHKLTHLVFSQLLEMTFHIILFVLAIHGFVSTDDTKIKINHKRDDIDTLIYYAHTFLVYKEKNTCK